MKTEKEIYDQIDLTYEKDFSGMSYAEGVRAALEWILEENPSSTPMED